MNIFDKAKKKRRGGPGKGSSDAETEEEVIVAPEISDTLEMIDAALKETEKMHHQVSRQIDLEEERTRYSDYGRCRC